jgi:hypothetical protein
LETELYLPFLLFNQNVLRLDDPKLDLIIQETCQLCFHPNHSSKDVVDNTLEETKRKLPCLANHLQSLTSTKDHGICFYCLLPRKLGTISLHKEGEMGRNCPYYSRSGNVMAFYLLKSNHAKQEYPHLFNTDDGYFNWKRLFEKQDSSKQVRIGMNNEPVAIHIAKSLIDHLETLSRL